MGTDTAFFDLGLRIANPALGPIANAAGWQSVCLVSALGVLGAATVAMRLLHDATPIKAGAAACQAQGDCRCFASMPTP
jgi:hypothetical protein